MTHNNSPTTKSLFPFGFNERYLLNIDGTITDIKKGETKRRDKRNSFYLLNNQNKYVRISLKSLYKQVYNKEYSNDSIQNINGEIWEEIPNTNGKYFISTCGRVKSYCGYTARILSPLIQNGYCYVQIGNKKHRIHRIVASVFIPNDNPKEKNTVHHINRNTQDNNINNLMWLSLIDNIQQYYKDIKQ